MVRLEQSRPHAPSNCTIVDAALLGTRKVLTPAPARRVRGSCRPGWTGRLESVCIGSAIQSETKALVRRLTPRCTPMLYATASTG